MQIGDSVIDSLREKLEKSVLISYTPISNSLWESLNASARNSAWK